MDFPDIKSLLLAKGLDLGEIQTPARQSARCFADGVRTEIITEPLALISKNTRAK